MNVARRGFLKLMGAVPIAAPIAAKEAMLAASGVASGIGVGAVTKYAEIADSQVAGLKPDGSWADHLRSRLAHYLSPEYRSQLLREEHPSRLDPDIAAMRSISPSAQIAIQRKRNVDKYLADRVRKTNHSLEEWAKHAAHKLFTA